MTHIPPAMTKSVVIVTHSGQKQNKVDAPELKVDFQMRSYLNDVTFKTARPLVISMTLFGLLYLSERESRWALITKIYSTLVLLSMWALFIWSFTVYGSEGARWILIFKIIVHSWMCLCTFAATSTYIACRSQNKLVEFVSRWSKLIKQNHGSGQALKEAPFDGYVRKVKLNFYSCLIVSWLAIIIAIVSIGYIFFETKYLDFLIHPMEPTHPQAILLKGFLYVIQVYMCAAWVLTICLFYNIGFVTYEEFRIFHTDFQKAIQISGDVACLGNYRRRHQEICLLVENADDILSGFSAVSILMAMVYGMLVLYNIIWYRDQYDVMLMATNIFWLLSSLLYLGVIAVGGGYLNHMAHSPLKTIHNIQLNTFTTDTSLQTIMFLSKLTAESIGLTAMGMFVIDKPTILTIAGAFLTYFVVLIQFQQPFVQQEALWNCTASFSG